MEIKRLGDDSIQRIVAEQAITDLASIVKELVDNALDAESTTVKIRLFGQGLDIIEVSDDGTGVPMESRPFLAQRYATSKITSFEDIYTGTGLTMGFRGEALFSMACLSRKLVVATRTEGDEMAQKFEFGRDGKLLDPQPSEMHRKIGTTVAVVEPFAALPARRVHMKRRIRDERTKLFKLMEAYAIFNVGVQLNLIDITSGREDVTIATSSTSTSLEQTVSSVLGTQFLGSVVPMELPLDSLFQQQENIYNWGIKGLISKNPRGAMPNRLVNYYSINGRVVELPKITQVLKRIWNGFGGKRKPSCIISFTLPNDAFDINLSPDKQKVLMSHEQEICQVVDEYVTKYWSSQTQGVFKLQEFESTLSNSDAESNEGERQRHKRRFAFVNDLSNAKLQHDLDERKKCEEVEEKKQAEIDPERSGPDRATANGVLVENSVNSTAEEIAQDPAPPPSSSEPGDSSKPTADETVAISDMERRQWMEARIKFNTHDSLKRSRIVPVTPDDALQEVECSPPTKRRLTAPMKGLLKGNIRDNQSNETSIGQSQLSLRQFAYQSTRRSSTQPTKEPNKSRNAKDICEKESYKGDSPSMIAKRTVAMHDIENSKKSLPNRASTRRLRSHNEVPLAVDAGIDATLPDDQNLEGCEKGNTSDEGGLDDASRSKLNSNDGRETIPATNTVIWNDFSTANVCRQNRVERIQMIRRTIGLAESRTIKNGDSGDTTEDVTKSVGTSEISKPSSSVSLSKAQFRNEMHVIGQFNLGFILVRCKNNNLWILDQHACDEKYNFEQLCQNTVIHEQKLLKPMQLDLSPAEEACILDHMNIFEANGFQFVFNPEAPIRKRLAVSALPHSGAQDGRKAVQFDKDDIRSLCSILMEGSAYDAGDGGTGTDGSGRHGNNAVRRYASTSGSQVDSVERIIARLPKAIAMFASRACRTSIMIGTALSRKEMEKIVQRLADVEHPWNCPHGRPTMRHVGEILPILCKDERRAGEYISSPTVAVAPMTQEPCSKNED